MSDIKVSNPLRGHVVHFPKAIPSQKWLSQRMLWADHLGAVWPFDFPHDENDEEHAALQAARFYQDAGFFTPCEVPWDAGRPMLEQLYASLKLSKPAYCSMPGASRAEPSTAPRWVCGSLETETRSSTRPSSRKTFSGYSSALASQSATSSGG